VRANYSSFYGIKIGEAGKFDYRSKMEQTLIADGYYTGTEEVALEKGV